MYRTKKDCLTLPIWELSLLEYARCYPDALCTDHYAAVKLALLKGNNVHPDYATDYPSLANVKPKRKRNAQSRVSGSSGDDGETDDQGT